MGMGMSMRLLIPGLCLVVAGSAACAQDAAAVRRGEALLAKECSRCHAMARADESRHPQAPLFRTLAKRYPIESLEGALGEGFISGHPDMPEFKFDSDDVGAIVASLESIQTSDLRLHYIWQHLSSLRHCRESAMGRLSDEEFSCHLPRLWRFQLRRRRFR